MVLEVNEVGAEDVVIDDFVGGFSEEEVEMSIVFFVQVLVDWLGIKLIYFGLHATFPLAIPSLYYNLNNKGLN